MLWYEIIRDIAGNEQKAVTLFYVLCKIFFEDYKKKRGYFLWRNDLRYKRGGKG